MIVAWKVAATTLCAGYIVQVQKDDEGICSPSDLVKYIKTTYKFNVDQLPQKLRDTILGVLDEEKVAPNRGANAKSKAVKVKKEKKEKDNVHSKTKPRRSDDVVTDSGRNLAGLWCARCEKVLRVCRVLRELCCACPHHSS